MNGVGLILLQIGEDKKLYPGRFGYTVFNDREPRYSQAKLELYDLRRALKDTQLFTIGVKKFIVEMDAKFIKGMLNSPTLCPNDAINRWISAILLLDFELVHVLATRHTEADGLSRLPEAPEDSDGLEDCINENVGFYLELSSPQAVFDKIQIFLTYQNYDPRPPLHTSRAFPAPTESFVQ